MSGATRRSRLPTIALAAACLGLGYMVSVEMSAVDDPSAGPPVAVRPADIDKLPPVQRPAKPPLSRFSQTLERPLFHVSRRPPPPAPEQPSAPPVSLKIKLIGVIISPDGRTALISVAGAAEISELTQGQSIQGWLVERIEPDRIVLRNDDARETYLLETEF